METNTRVKNPDTQPPKTPPAGLKNLEVLIGKWSNETHFRTDPENEGTGTITYEWMEGGFFIVEHFENSFSKEKPHKGIRIIGFDESKGCCTAHFFDSFGYTRQYEVSIEDNLLKIAGEFERYSGAISENGRKITGTWEQAKDGTNWQYLCDVRQTKLR